MDVSVLPDLRWKHPAPLLSIRRCLPTSRLQGSNWELHFHQKISLSEYCCCSCWHQFRLNRTCVSEGTIQLNSSVLSIAQMQCYFLQSHMMSHLVCFTDFQLAVCFGDFGYVEDRQHGALYSSDDFHARRLGACYKHKKMSSTMTYVSPVKTIPIATSNTSVPSVNAVT